MKSYIVHLKSKGRDAVTIGLSIDHAKLLTWIHSPEHGTLDWSDAETVLLAIAQTNEHFT